MNNASFVTRRIEAGRHRTARIEAGPADGPLPVFVHGWIEVGHERTCTSRSWRRPGDTPCRQRVGDVYSILD